MKIFGLIVLLLHLAACSTEQVRRTEAIILDPSANLGGSSGSNLYSTSKTTGWTAIGQLFKVPTDHTYLTKFGFHCSASYSWQGEKTDLRLVLRISKWDGNKPEAQALFVSLPAVIKKDFAIGWIHFDVPHLKLDPKATYVAWVSLGEQGNPVNASILIFHMRPRTSSPGPQYKGGSSPIEWEPTEWTIDYVEGSSVMWAQPNPNGSIEVMTKSAWRKEAWGVNNKFSMRFENIP